MEIKTIYVCTYIHMYNQLRQNVLRLRKMNFQTKIYICMYVHCYQLYIHVLLIERFSIKHRVTPCRYPQIYAHTQIHM